MEPKFQTSFIPKKPLDSSPKDYLREQPKNIVSIIATVLFVLTVFVSIGLFVYKQIVIRQIANINSDITKARGSMEENTLKDIIKYSDQISFAQKILNSHIVTYPLFAQLENYTLKNISFKNFKYSNKNGSIDLTSDVTSKSYNALAQQSDIFTKNQYIKNPIFSNFELNQDGNIDGKFSASVDPALLLYKNNIGS